MIKLPSRMAAAAISASLLLSCCCVVPPAYATQRTNASDDSTRATIVDGELGGVSISYARDQDGVEESGTYVIFYNTTRSILYHTGTGNTDQVTGTASGNTITLDSTFAAERQLWTIEKRDGDDGYNVKSVASGRYLDLSQTTAANGHVKTSEQPVRVDITFHQDSGTYSLSNGSNYLTHGSTAGNKYYCSTSTDATLIQFQLYEKTEVLPTVVEGNPKGTDAISVPFNSEATGSRHFRIPSLYTLDNGWIVAASDIRWTTSGDSPQNLDTIVSVSKDNGQTWEWEVVNYFSDMTESTTSTASASFIDPSIVQDRNGTVHMVVDACPSYVGLMGGNHMGQESTGFDDQGRLLVAMATAGTYAPTTVSSYTYYVDLNNGNDLAVVGSDEGTDVTLYPICSADGTVSDTWVDAWLNVYEKSTEDGTFTKLYVAQLGNSSKRVQKNLFYQNSEWKVYPVFYIMYRSAQVTDKGLTWSAPQFLDIKMAANEKFTGVCPGRGNTMSFNGKERIVFPLYDNRTGNELASVIYSDDGGITWQRGQHNGNLNGVGKTSESQVVTLPNGDLRMYSRNTINYVSYADSTDGGVTWGQCQPDEALFSQKSGGGCMVSFINLEGTLVGPDDQEYDNLILGSYARIQRSEGVVRIGSVAEDGTVTWLNDDATRYTGVNNCFAYSCVSQLQEDGKATDTFGILYENQSSPCQIAFETLTVEDLLGTGWYMVQDESEKVTLSLDQTFVNLNVDESIQVEATVVPDGSATVTWASDTPGVATVNDSGLVTGKASGIATITATATAPNGIVRIARLSVAVQGEDGIVLPQLFRDVIAEEQHEAVTTYDLDTDGIDSGSVYAIYHAGTKRILYHANNATNTDQVTGSVSESALALDVSYAASRQLWRITQTDNGYTVQSMEADGKYLKLNDTATNPGTRVPVQSDPYTLTIEAGSTPGTYTIAHTVNSQKLYLSHTTTATEQYNVSADACELQLFKVNTIDAHSTYQVTLSGLQALVDFVGSLNQQSYTSDSWDALQSAKQAANSLLDEEVSTYLDETQAQSKLTETTDMSETLYQAWLELTPAHTYGQPVFEWNADHTQATVTFTCNQDNCEYTKTVDAQISSAVKTPATCTVKGITTYTATVVFEGETYTATKDVQDIPVIAHTYGDPEFTWAADDKSATATFTCTCGDEKTVEAEITSAVKTEATCTQMGTTTYTATVEFEGKTYTATKDVQDIPVTDHHYEGGICVVCGAEDPDYVKPTDPVETDPVETDPAVTDKPVVTEKPQPTAKPQDKVEVTVSQEEKVETAVGGVSIVLNNVGKVFETGINVIVEKISQGDIFTNVETALANVVEKMDNTAIFEFTAENAQGQKVQPQGNLSVTFAIPSNLSENNLKMFYVSVTGEKEEIAITVNKAERTVTANLEHFSTYVLVNVVADTTDGGNVPQTGDNASLTLYVVATMSCMALLSATVIVYRKQRNI